MGSITPVADDISFAISVEISPSYFTSMATRGLWAPSTQFFAKILSKFVGHGFLLSSYFILLSLGYNGCFFVQPLLLCILLFSLFSHLLLVSLQFCWSFELLLTSIWIILFLLWVPLFIWDGWEFFFFGSLKGHNFAFLSNDFYYFVTFVSKLDEFTFVVSNCFDWDFISSSKVIEDKVDSITARISKEEIKMRVSESKISEQLPFVLLCSLLICFLFLVIRFFRISFILFLSFLSGSFFVRFFAFKFIFVSSFLLSFFGGTRT